MLTCIHLVFIYSGFALISERTYIYNQVRVGELSKARQFSYTSIIS